jgi:hypothetical protein
LFLLYLRRLAQALLYLDGVRLEIANNFPGVRFCAPRCVFPRSRRFFLPVPRTAQAFAMSLAAPAFRTHCPTLQLLEWITKVRTGGFKFW